MRETNDIGRTVSAYVSSEMIDKRNPNMSEITIVIERGGVLNDLQTTSFGEAAL